jgi:hypothetical protein
MKLISAHSNITKSPLANLEFDLCQKNWTWLKNSDTLSVKNTLIQPTEDICEIAALASWESGHNFFTLFCNQR